MLWSQMDFGTLSALVSRKIRRRMPTLLIMNSFLTVWQPIMSLIHSWRNQQRSQGKISKSSLSSSTTIYHKLFTTAWRQLSQRIETGLRSQRLRETYSIHFLTCSPVWLSSLQNMANGLMVIKVPLKELVVAILQQIRKTQARNRMKYLL